MSNHIDIDLKTNSAIMREMGERLRASMQPESRLPSSLKTRIDRLREQEDRDSPSHA